MNKRKSEGGKGQDDSEPSVSKKVYRTNSSSSSNSDEWLCASTKHLPRKLRLLSGPEPLQEQVDITVTEQDMHSPSIRIVPYITACAITYQPRLRVSLSQTSRTLKIAVADGQPSLPDEALSLPHSKSKRKPTLLATLPNSNKVARNSATECCTPSTSRDNASSYGIHPVSCTSLRSYARLVSPELHNFAKRSKRSKGKRSSLPAFPILKASPLFRKASDIISSEAIAKWPSFSSIRRKNVVLELDAVPSTSDEHYETKPCSSTDNTMLVEESPLKTDISRPCKRSPSPSLRKSECSVVADSQRSSRSLKTRSLENTRLGIFHKISMKKELTWPTLLNPLVSSTTTPEKDKPRVCGNSAITETVLESSPDEKSPSISASKPTVSSAETKSSVLTDVIEATQEFLGESDDDYQPMSEHFDIDEVTRLVPSHSSAEKKEEDEDPDEEDSSSDEDDELSRSSIAKMNLSGRALQFAEYMLARRSERLMIKRDPNVATETFEVIRTVSAWGMSVSWLSPKAVMYAPPFSRDPSTVTLALPLLKIPNIYDPEMPIILNPIIVSTTQETMVAESSAE